MVARGQERERCSADSKSRMQSNGAAGVREQMDGCTVGTGYVEVAVVDTHVPEAVLEEDGDHQDDMAYI